MFVNSQQRSYQVQKEMTKRETHCQTIFKIILSIVTFCGLIYQVQIIYKQFMTGKTVINLEIGRNSNVSLPAITICYQALFSMERAAEYN